MSLSAEKTACDLILFGTKGDLALRKLLPALYELDQLNLLHPDTRIIGVARDGLSASEYIELVQSRLLLFLNSAIDADIWQRFKHRLHYVQLDLTDKGNYEKLLAVTDVSTRNLIGYFATPPSLYGQICEGLAAFDLNARPARVILEKPIGHNLDSSRQINDQVANYFQEQQIYRIDHYLGKETVLNLLALRFANSIFAANWDHHHIDHVQITAAETVGAEGRWSYYDDAGQLRDMVQNHLLQVLSLIAMEPPATLDADSIRDEKIKVLKALRPIDESNVAEHSVRGQYASGKIGETTVPAYLGEEGANKESATETFVALKVLIDNWRWSGVPFYLRTGKRLPQKRTEIVICFKQLPHEVFSQSAPANKLIIRLQPDEGIEIQMMNKAPGLGEPFQLKQTKLDLNFAESFQSQRIPDAYERLLLEAMMGQQYLFVHRKEVEQAWKWIDGVIDAWQASQQNPIHYEAGTSGPAESERLLGRDGRQWEEMKCNFAPIATQTSSIKSLLSS